MISRRGYLFIFVFSLSAVIHLLPQSALATTLPPILSSPTSSSTLTNSVHVQYELPEFPSVVTLTFTNQSAQSAVFQMSANTSVDFTFDPTSPTAVVLGDVHILDISPSFAGSVLPDGTYTVTLAYQNSGGDPEASATATNVVIDSTPPSPPGSFSAIATGTNVALTWTNPVSDFASVTIKRSTSTYPATVSTGTTVVAGSTGTSQANNGLSEGTYYYSIFALDSAGNVSSAAHATVTVDITPPSAPSGFSANAVSNTVNLSWTNPVSDFASVTIRRSTSSTPISISGGSPVASGISGTTQSDTSLADGTYYYSIFALDSAGNVSVAETASVTVDTVTQTPILTSPTTSSTNTTMHLVYTLPETPQHNTVLVLLEDGTTSTLLSMDDTTSVNVTLQLSDLTASSHVTLSNHGTLANGNYTVTVQYQDGLGNAAASVSASSVLLDATTQTPILTTPTTGNYNNLHLSYSLPESPLAGSVHVLFTNSQAQTSTFTMGNSQTGNITFNPTSTNATVSAANFTAISSISSSFTTVLPDETYTVTVQYQDGYGNPLASAIATGVVIDTVAPVITLVGNSAVTLTAGETYTDAGATASDAHDGNLTSSIVTVNSVNATVAGEYTVTYNITDATGNVAATVTRTVTVVPAAVADTTDDPTDDTTDQEDNTDTDTDTEGVVPITTIRSNGKVIRVLVNGVVVDSETINDQTYRTKYFKLATAELYNGYTTVVLVTINKTEAKLTVLRLTSDHRLKKKVTKTFTLDSAETATLKIRAAKQRIIANHQVYRLTATGKLQVME